MSEVLNAKVSGGKAHGVSRRRVIAGVAWTVPVIATAIAAPAAAASAIFSMASGPFQGITFSKRGVQGQGHVRSGQGPATLTVENTSGLAQTVSVGIVPTVSSGAVRAGIAIKALDGSVVNAAPVDAGYASTATITISGNQPVSRAISFHYVEGTGQSAPTVGQVYTFTLTLTTASTSVVIPGITMTIAQ